ncbi:MAG: hypothetical protein ACTSRZ_12785 [Promethearchaeota archaeon]
MIFDPYLREISPNPNIDNYMIYSACRGGLEAIGVEIDDASEEKRVIKGYYLGNKKNLIKVAWKPTDEGGFKIKIFHKMKFNDNIFKRRDLRDLSGDKYQELIIVKFWDEVYRDLGLGLAPGFGEKKLAAKEENKKEKLRNYFANVIDVLIESDNKLHKYTKGVNFNFNEILMKYRSILEIINKKSKFPKETLYGIEIFFDEGHSIERTIVMTINTLDMKTVTMIPIEVNLFLVMPRPLPRQLDMGYKCKWTAPTEESDDVAFRIIYKINFEYSGLERELLKFYSKEYLYHFIFKETFEDKGKMTKYTHDQMLLYPINLQRINHPITKKETFVLVLRYLLKINKRNQYEGFIPVSDCFTLMNKVFNVLKPFFVKTEEEIRREQELQRQKEKTEESEVIRKCVKCGWLLSKNSKKCPMCGAPVQKERKKTLNVDSTYYDKSSALLDAQQKVYSEKLIKDFDKLLEEWGDPKSKLKSAVKETFLVLLEKVKAKGKISEIVDDEDLIEIEIGKVSSFYKKLFADDMEVIVEFLVKLRDYEIPWIHIAIQLLDLGMEDVFPILISYTILGEYISRSFSFIKLESKKRKEKDQLIWQVDQGEDPKIVQTLNSASSDFNEIIQKAYQKKSTYTYIEPLIDEKGRVKGTRLTLDLYPIIRVEPFYSRKIGHKTIICMRQFLDFKQSGYIPIPIVFAILETIYSIIDIFKEEYNEEKKEKIIDFEMLDKRIEQSKYTYQKKLREEAETVYGKISHSNSEQSDLLEQKPPSQNQSVYDAESDSSIMESDQYSNININNPKAKTISAKSSLSKTELAETPQEMEVEDDIQSILKKYESSITKSPANYRLKTYFIKEIPSDFYIDPYMTDEEIDKKLFSLNEELNSLYALAEMEINSLASKQQSFEICMSQLNTLLNQIKQKQAIIRAYEYEKFRVKTERLKEKELKKEFADLI